METASQISDPSKSDKVLETTKHQSWKWLGALVMKPKTNAKGETHLAVSLTKVQKAITLLMAVILFTAMMVLWLVKPEALAGGVTDPIPGSMINTFWALLGLGGVQMVSGAIAYRKPGGSE